MTLWQLTILAAYITAALWTLYVLALRHLESIDGAVPSTVELQATADRLGKDDAWVRDMRAVWADGHIGDPSWLNVDDDTGVEALMRSHFGRILKPIAAKAAQARAMARAELRRDQARRRDGGAS